MVPEWLKMNLAHARAASSDAFERLPEGVLRTDLVVPIGADDQEMPDLPVRDDVLEELERRRVEPLQVVEEDRERMLPGGERAEQPAEHQLESILRFLRRKLRDRRLLADDELDLRNHARDQLAVGSERGSDGITPSTELVVSLAQDAADDALQRLRERRIGNFTLGLVGLPAREKAAGQRLLQLLHQRRLADARRSGHERELRSRVRRESCERRAKALDVALPPVQPLRHREAVARVLRGEREGIDAAGRLELGETPAQVRFHSRGGLVTLFGSLGEQLQNDRLDDGGDAGRALSGRRRRPGDLKVNPLHRLRGGKGELAGEHLVERHAEGIKVAPRID